MDAIGIWEKVRASMGEQRGWKVLYNLGLAYEKVGDATHAVERLEGFVQRLAEQPGTMGAELDERRQDALQRVHALQESNGALRVLAPTGERALVRVDAQPPRAAGFTAYLAPGEHDIEIDPGTPRARRVTVTLRAGASQDFPVERAPPSAPHTPGDASASTLGAGVGVARAGEAARAPEPRAFPTAWAIAGGVVTIAAGAAPFAFGLHAAAKRDDAARLGVGSTQYPSAVNDFTSARTVYYVSYAIPATTLALSTVFVLIKWSASGGERTALTPCLGGACARF
jgi:hypothetical protein